MKKIIAIALIVVIVIAGIIFVPKLVHTCDSCDTFFIGVGYKPNAVSDLFSEDMNVICKDCAEKHHMLEIALGKSVDDYKLDLF